MKSPNCQHKLEFLVGTKAGFLTLCGTLCWGACVTIRRSKPWLRYSMTHIIMESILYGLKCSAKARSGATALPGSHLEPWYTWFQVWFHSILHIHEFIYEFIGHEMSQMNSWSWNLIWIHINSYMNSWSWRISWNHARIHMYEFISEFMLVNS